MVAIAHALRAAVRHFLDTSSFLDNARRVAEVVFYLYNARTAGLVEALADGRETTNASGTFLKERVS
jgi:hypothetical protein